MKVKRVTHDDNGRPRVRYRVSQVPQDVIELAGIGDGAQDAAAYHHVEPRGARLQLVQQFPTAVPRGAPIL